MPNVGSHIHKKIKVVKAEADTYFVVVEDLLDQENFVDRW